jgi:hypothetical protein
MLWYFGLPRHVAWYMNTDVSASLTTSKFFPENEDRIILQNAGANLQVWTVA